MKSFDKIFPWCIFGLGATYLAWVLSASGPDDSTFNWSGFGSIPVVHNGRVKPLETVARANLVLITGKQTYKDDKKRFPAIVWLMEVMNHSAGDLEVFRIDNDQVLSLLGLKERPGLRYAASEFWPKVPELLDEAKKGNKLDLKKLDPLERLYFEKVTELAGHLRLFFNLAKLEVPLADAPIGRSKDDWRPLEDAFEGKGQESISAAAFSFLFRAYSDNDPATFNQVIENYQKVLQKQLGKEIQTIPFEVFFNRFEPFHQAAVLYVFAFIFGCLSWLGWSQPLRRAAFWLALLAFVVHTWGILGRMYILGRPPVINLYSSGVFIGWGCIGVCLFLEYVYRNSIAIIVGSVLASVTGGVIAHYLSLDQGDTMEMMQAVLDTNLWLATHVTCVTLGYTATFVSGFLGLAYVILGLLTPLLRKDGAGNLAKMIYGVVCFATLLSFTGTVLGGIWADQSWGRFWGWDPKENGALLIVIWNALILHARWAGIVKQRGMAQLAIGGNIVTAWSWFGTNMLGVGLHSYGFMPAAVTWMIVFVVTQLVMIGISFIPQRFWMSFKKEPPRPAAPGGIVNLPRLPATPKTSITASS